jgi:hypothetical protein
MNNKILIAASVGLSLFAAAQSLTDKQRSKPVTTQVQSRDAASAQVSGKKSAQDDWSQSSAVSTTNSATTKPVSANSDTKAKTRVATGDVNGDGGADATAGKNSAHATEAVSATGTATTKPVSMNSDTKAKTHVATGDVNGDGTTDATAGKNSAHATEAASATTSTAASKDQHPRDAASGQASGKRQHQPMTVNKANDKSPNQ